MGARVRAASLPPSCAITGGVIYSAMMGRCTSGLGKRRRWTGGRERT